MTEETLDAHGDWIVVDCPCCGESLEILIDAETLGSLVQDCEVCCNPWLLTIRRRGSDLEVQVEAS